jgi:ABC-type transport system substrate-binding protein
MTPSDAASGHSEDDRPLLASGTELAGYRVDVLLGRGGMGVVYRALDLALDRNVALKLLAPELAEDVRFRERFLRESRLAASLDHPAIIPIYDAGEVAGRLYIAMRLVEGTDLKRLLAEQGELDAARALALLEQVADALDAAHERGLVHRDVKPSNVLVDDRGHCYLADFGLSRRVAESGSTGAGRSLGTVDYVAPEQIRGDELDGRADLYSLGCLLFECLAGRPPFARGSETAVVFAHLEEEPPSLPRLAPVIAKALAKQPKDRYQSGAELIAAARAALRPARLRRGPLIAALAVVLALAGAAAALVATHQTSLRSPPAARRQALPLAADTYSIVDARERRVVASIPGARHGVTDLAFTGRAAWLVVPEESLLVRIDVGTRKVTKVVSLPWVPSDRVAGGGGLVWLREARNLGTDVLGIDARSGRIVRRFSIGGSSIGVAYGADSLWLVGGGDILRVEPRTGRTVRHYSANADQLVYADGALWAASSDGSVWKIDPVGNTIVAHAKLHPVIGDLTVGDRSVWVSVLGENKVYELSEDDLGVLQAAPAGLDPERVAAWNGTVWIANTSGRGISKLTEQSGQLTHLATGSEPTALAVHKGLVWVPSVRPLPPLPPISGQEIRISLPSRFFNVDPVSRVFPMDEQITAATCAGLLDYGPHGLRPEVAAAMPTISPDGRTYTFHIRKGFRFSPPSNEPVTAQTFRYTIERTLSPLSQDSYYAPDIVGLGAFVAAVKAGQRAHISGIRARGMTLSVTLARPAGDLPARLAIPLFCPVPLSTPFDPKRVRAPVASDGPYYFATVDSHRLVLLRNPTYGGRRPRRAARIVIDDDVPTPTAVGLVDSGKLDYLPNDFAGGTTLLGPSGELARISGPGSAAARAGRQRFFVHAQPMFDTVVFNTRRALFRSLRLRQAVEYAVDRPAMARAFFDAPSERVVPLPGYGVRHVYPLGRPDVRTARRLAGPQRRTAVLLMACDFSAAPAANVLRSNLARIGITVDISRLRSCDPNAVVTAFSRADMIIGTNLFCSACERDPAVFVQGLLEHGLKGAPLPPGPWDAPPFQRRLEHAAALRGRTRAAAYRRLDDELARFAPVVVYGSFLYGEYFGARIGCKRFPPFQQGVDLGSLCVGRP